MSDPASASYRPPEELAAAESVRQIELAISVLVQCNARLGDEIVRLRDALGLIRGSALADGTAGELRRIAEEALK